MMLRSPRAVQLLASVLVLTSSCSLILQVEERRRRARFARQLAGRLTALRSHYSTAAADGAGTMPCFQDERGGVYLVPSLRRSRRRRSEKRRGRGDTNEPSEPRPYQRPEPVSEPRNRALGAPREDPPISARLSRPPPHIRVRLHIPRPSSPPFSSSNELSTSGSVTPSPPRTLPPVLPTPTPMATAMSYPFPLTSLGFLEIANSAGLDKNRDSLDLISQIECMEAALPEPIATNHRPVSAHPRPVSAHLRPVSMHPRPIITHPLPMHPEADPPPPQFRLDPLTSTAQDFLRIGTWTDAAPDRTTISLMMLKHLRVCNVDSLNVWLAVWKRMCCTNEDLLVKKVHDLYESCWTDNRSTGLQQARLRALAQAALPLNAGLMRKWVVECCNRGGWEICTGWITVYTQLRFLKAADHIARHLIKADCIFDVPPEQTQKCLEALHHAGLDHFELNRIHKAALQCWDRGDGEKYISWLTTCTDLGFSKFARQCTPFSSRFVNQGWIFDRPVGKCLEFLTAIVRAAIQLDESPARAVALLYWERGERDNMVTWIKACRELGLHDTSKTHGSLPAHAIPSLKWVTNQPADEMRAFLRILHHDLGIQLSHRQIWRTTQLFWGRRDYEGLGAWLQECRQLNMIGDRFVVVTVFYCIERSQAYSLRRLMFIAEDLGYPVKWLGNGKFDLECNAVIRPWWRNLMSDADESDEGLSSAKDILLAQELAAATARQDAKEAAAAARAGHEPVPVPVRETVEGDASLPAQQAPTESVFWHATATESRLKHKLRHLASLGQWEALLDRYHESVALGWVPSDRCLNFAITAALNLGGAWNPEAQALIATARATGSKHIAGSACNLVRVQVQDIVKRHEPGWTLNLYHHLKKVRAADMPLHAIPLNLAARYFVYAKCPQLALKVCRMAVEEHGRPSDHHDPHASDAGAGNWGLGYFWSRAVQATTMAGPVCYHGLHVLIGELIASPGAWTADDVVRSALEGVVTILRTRVEDTIRNGGRRRAHAVALSSVRAGLHAVREKRAFVQSTRVQIDSMLCTLFPTYQRRPRNRRGYIIET